MLQLVKRAQRGEILAFEALLARYRDELTRECKHSVPAGLRRRFDPDDVLQDALTSAWEKIASFRFQGNGSFRAWLRQILTNALRDGIKHHCREMRHPCWECAPAADAAEELAGHDEDRPDAHFWRREDERRLREALVELDAPLRAVAELRLEEPDLSWETVALRVGCSTSTARRRFDEAKRLMRVRLGRELVPGKPPAA